MESCTKRSLDKTGSRSSDVEIAIIFLAVPEREKCSESVSFSHSTQKNDQSNWEVCLRKDR